MYTYIIGEKEKKRKEKFCPGNAVQELSSSRVRESYSNTRACVFVPVPNDPR